MSSHLGTSETLALLKQLRDAVREFTAREDKLNAEFRARTTAQTRTFEAAAAAQVQHSAETVAKADAAFQEQKRQCQLRFDQRKVRINQAHMSSRKRALDAIRDKEGKRKYKVQEGTLNAERRRDADLKQAATDIEALNARLAQNGEEQNRIEVDVRKAFGGFAGFKQLLSATVAPDLTLSHDKDVHLNRLDQLQEQMRQQLKEFRRTALMQIVRVFRMWVIMLLFIAGVAMLLPGVESRLNLQWPVRNIGLAVVVIAVVLGVARMFVTQRMKPAATALAHDVVRGRARLEECARTLESWYANEVQRIKTEFETNTQGFDQEWKKAVKESIDLLGVRPAEVDEQARRVTEKNDQLYRSKITLLERAHPETLSRLRQEGEVESGKVRSVHAEKMAVLNTDLQQRFAELEKEWRDRIQPIYDRISVANESSQKLFPGWQLELWRQWKPPQDFKNAAKFGRMQVDAFQLVETAPKDHRLLLPSPTLSAPLLLNYPKEGSILFETANTGSDEALHAINNIIFRLLSTTPPGKLTFTIFDPVGLGQNFAGLMHLADYEESHINSRIWTQTNQLEEKLGELNEHMEKVIQMYLRNEYPTIAEYNAQAGAIAEKYHFLVVADFPVNFSDTALRRLINIATSGSRCGVYTLIHWDRRQALPQGIVPDELRKSCVTLVRGERGFDVHGSALPGTHIELDPPPSPDVATEFLRRVGESGKDSNRVEVPFVEVAPSEADIWTQQTAEELRVPIGRSGATKLQYLEIGKGTRQHALIAGKTGSGKSTLFHVIITNLALWCSPDQVEFYLVDFKKGVEFKCYASRHLPHARVVAIESDREFGLSVLQRVDEELRRRGDLFRELGVQDLAGYKRAGGKEAMPRSLLMIDEFQEFFTEEDRVSQGAAVLLDRIVRQGRAFGIHVLLGSQTLGGAYTLARATIGQMVIRIALQCNEADAYLIMDQDNPAPRLLSRPGEGIYNDAAGAIEGNSPFQAVWLSEQVRDECLAKVRRRADEKKAPYPGPFVFEGNAPADVRDNLQLRHLLQVGTPATATLARVWLGAPNSIKGPTEAVFQRQTGSNLLIVGQSDERALTLLAMALISLSAQHPKAKLRFVLLDSTPQGVPQREFLARVIRTIPHEILEVKPGDLAETMARLAQELKDRAADEESDGGVETFILIQGLQNYKKLRQEDEFSFSSSDSETIQPGTALLNLLSEGPSKGFHLLVTCDTYNNVSRFVGRKTLSEFEMRVLFQMSASDSASLIDEPDASVLGLNRALYYNDREGYTETFRPYALPEPEWIEQVGQQLKKVAEP